MKQILLCVFLLPCFAQAQIIKDNDKTIDPYKTEIQKNIFRVLLSAATDTKFSFTANYEREIIKPLTIFVKAGPAFSREYINTDAFGNKEYNWLLNAMASGELRAYYNLKRRERKDRTVRNFSAFYLSLEQQLVSKPIFILNKTGEEDMRGRSRAFVNIGYQYQKSHTYLGIFFGTRFPGKIYSNVSSGVDLLHAGISVGRVF